MRTDAQFVLLWTDALLFALLAVALWAAWHARADEALRAAWLKVGQRPVGMVAAVLLSSFVLIGLVDSVHYRPLLPPVAEAGNAEAEGAEGAGAAVYSTEVLSALDALLESLRLQTEKTYSAPFARVLYQRETIELADGSQWRGFPPLQYGGAHLGASVTDDGGEQGQAADIARRVTEALALAAAGWLGLVGVLLAALRAASGESWRATSARLWRGQTRLAWRSVLLTAGVVLALLALGVQLAPFYHVFGTDKVGQDVLYLALKSVRTALIIGSITTLVMLPVALVLGIAAGYLGGWVDDVVQYIYTVLNAIPGVLLIAAAVLMMQVLIDTHPQWFDTAAQRSDARLLALCFILGITSWTGLARLLRGETLKLRELEYVQAARAFGVGTPAILRRHILPNLMHIVLIALVMDFSGLVLAEAVLSYVGIGVDPTTISFGTMINMARAELAREPMVWWSLSAAFVFMFVLVLAANLFADVVRDAFDPRQS